MGASKSDTRGAVHREARNDDAASSSSAILLDNVDRYDEEDGEGQEEDDLPPAYDADEISEAQGRNDGVAFWDWRYVISIRFKPVSGLTSLQSSTYSSVLESRLE
jgi:hypothetical protein